MSETISKNMEGGKENKKEPLADGFVPSDQHSNTQNSGESTEHLTEKNKTDKDSSCTKRKPSKYLTCIKGCLEDPRQRLSSVPKRYVLLSMIFLGFINIYALRVNLNVALVAMVNNRTVTLNGQTIDEIAEFHWDSKTQGLVLGAFFYGYWVLQVPGAWIAMRLGGTRVFGLGVFIASLLTILSAPAARHSVYSLVALRILEGVFLSVTYPCNHAIWSKWSPPLERTTMITVAIAGAPVGNIFAIPLTGLLSKYGFDGGWPSVFYCFGLSGCMWFFLWNLVVHESPAVHPTITPEEKQFIEDSIARAGGEDEGSQPPWSSIFKSSAVWGIIVGHFAACWGYYTLFTGMPTYFKDILHFDIEETGFLAACPYLFKAILGPIGGVSADLLIRYKVLRIRTVRALFYALGNMLAGIFIVCCGYFQTPYMCVLFLTLGVGFSGLNASGYAVNHLDIAPQYAGVLMGVSNTVATTPGFISPMVTGIIADSKKQDEWKIVFFITLAVYIVGTIIYTILVSGDLQPWAESTLSPRKETIKVDDIKDKKPPRTQP